MPGPNGRGFVLSGVARPRPFQPTDKEKAAAIGRYEGRLKRKDGGTGKGEKYRRQMQRAQKDE